MKDEHIFHSSPFTLHSSPGGAMMQYPKVILIGGVPLVGKSTVARALSARVAYGCLSTDDLGQAIGAVTTAQSHPAFHEMDGMDYREYYVNRSPDELIADARRRHLALWPAILQVITAHASWGDPLLLEGWALYPARVAELRLPNIASIWLIADETVLEARLRAAVDFYSGASDEEKMIRHFLARSRWHNQCIRQQADELKMPVIEVSSHTTVADLLAGCERALINAIRLV